MSLIEKRRFESWSKGGCDNSHYRLTQTTCCQTYCVEDDELHDLYFDPQDPAKRIALYQSLDVELFPCPICRAHHWDLISLDEMVVPTAWQWAGSKENA